MEEVKEAAIKQQRKIDARNVGKYPLPDSYGPEGQYGMGANFFKK